MYTQRQLRKTNEERSVVIDEVNLAQNHISMRDHFGATIRTQVNFSDPMIMVPKPGEEWIVERRNYDWFLKRRASHETLKTLAPGDVAIAAGTGRVYIGADEVIINDVIYLRAISGRVQSTGAIGGGSLFTVNKTGTGVYVVTYNYPFDTIPALSGAKLGGPGGYVSYSGNTTTAATFNIYNTAGALVDSNFSFIAMRVV